MRFIEAIDLGACPFNRFGGACGEYNSPKRSIRSLGQALGGLGWTDGRNVQIDVRWAGIDINRIRAVAQELVGLKPDIIMTTGTAATVAVQREMRTIPIIFLTGIDPVATGIVPRLNQPGGNVTGFAASEPALAPHGTLENGMISAGGGRRALLSRLSHERHADGSMAHATAAADTQTGFRQAFLEKQARLARSEPGFQRTFAFWAGGAGGSRNQRVSLKRQSPRPRRAPKTAGMQCSRPGVRGCSRGQTRSAYALITVFKDLRLLRHAAALPPHCCAASTSLLPALVAAELL
jgi:hypothetical protein